MIESYASYFASYLLYELENPENINNIILFGSVAAGNATKESDVDIFIDVKKDNIRFKENIEKILGGFYKSREALIFKNKGIDNKINVIVGKIDDWKELRKSIESNGIVLFGHYTASRKSAGKKYVIFSWDKIDKNRGAFLNKLYGFSVGEKHYKGLIETLNGKKIGKSSLMIPVESHKEIITLLKRYQVNAKAIEVWYEG